MGRYGACAHCSVVLMGARHNAQTDDTPYNSLQHPTMYVQPLSALCGSASPLGESTVDEHLVPNALVTRRFMQPVAIPCINTISHRPPLRSLLFYAPCTRYQSVAPRGRPAAAFLAPVRLF